MNIASDNNIKAFILKAYHILIKNHLIKSSVIVKHCFYALKLFSSTKVFEEATVNAVVSAGHKTIIKLAEG